MSKTHSVTAESGDTVKITFGGDFVRKSLPWLLGATMLGGGYTFKAQHDSEIASIREQLANIDGKLDVLIGNKQSRKTYGPHR